MGRGRRRKGREFGEEGEEGRRMRGERNVEKKRSERRAFSGQGPEHTHSTLVSLGPPLTTTTQPARGVLTLTLVL